VDLSSEGSAEYAFPLKLGAAVFDTLAKAGFTLLGGDLWRAEEDGLHPCHDGWFMNSGAGDPATAWAAFALRAPGGPEYYVTFVTG
jgi:hypothetical protein